MYWGSYSISCKIFFMKYFSMFSGVEGFGLGIHQAYEDAECVGMSEIDKYASSVLKYKFPNIKNYGDCTKIIPEELPDFDLLVGGFPCVLANTLITTQRGHIEIKDIKVGDMVLTHKNRFKKVVKTMNRKSDHFYNLKVQGSPLLQITQEHPLYCKKMIRVFDAKDRVNKRTFSKSEWIMVNELREDDFIGFGTWSDKYSSNKKELTIEECWLIGRYIADGFINNGKRKNRINSYNHKVIFCIGKHKLKEFLQVAEKSKYSIGKTEERTVYKCRIIDERFMNLCLECGKGAANKVIPFWLMNLPKNKLQYFIDGYISGDGCYSNGVYRATSVSKILIYQLGQIIHRLYKTPYCITYCKRPKTTIIEGRIVNQKDTWTIGFDKVKHKQDNSLWIDRNLYGRFVSKERINKSTKVYNIEVEEDNSYVANNLVLHNCQAFSIAGKRKGFNDMRGTLIYEVIRILKVKQPKMFLLENVKGLLSHDKGKTMEIICEELCEANYAIDFEVLNAKNFSVPQSRNRVFIVGKRLDTLSKEEIL